MDSNTNQRLNSAKKDTFLKKMLQILINLKKKKKITNYDYFIIKKDLKSTTSIFKKKFFFIKKIKNEKKAEKLVLEDLDVILLKIKSKELQFDNFFRKSTSKNEDLFEEEKIETSPYEKMMFRRRFLEKLRDDSADYKEFRIVLKKII